ncbi:5-hydroxytryptamine receptor 1-like [Uloborus diversus]|uniref:5-hydroxytryptamine receptor 1-like n=1 Tax=Uloborus diversus TaxID=327109 RepID=UPI002409EADA|nr:5-hydroxytryptamine receptor 1-like [Uloborus diversus]
MIVITAIGNMLVCLSVCLVRKLRRAPNFLLVSLAVSDLCVALLVMPIALHYELTGDWRLGATICNMWVAFDITCCTASILNLCMISVDRYLAITKPLTYGVRRRSRRTYVSIGLTWVMSTLVSVPPLLILGNEHGTEDNPTCDVSQNFGYQLYATLSSFYIPMLVMVMMYCKIYLAAKRVVESDKKGRLVAQRYLPKSGSGHSGQYSSNHRRSLSIEKGDGNANKMCTLEAYKVGDRAVTGVYRPKISAIVKDRKASITLGIIMTAFVVCWLPFFVVALLRSLFTNLWVPHVVRSCVLWLGYTNSMLNPIIYVTFHQDFRRSFKEMLCFRCHLVNETFREEAYRDQYGDTPLCSGPFPPTWPSPNFKAFPSTAPRTSICGTSRKLDTCNTNSKQMQNTFM